MNIYKALLDIDRKIDQLNTTIEKMNGTLEMIQSNKENKNQKVEVVVNVQA